MTVIVFTCPVIVSRDSVGVGVQVRDDEEESLLCDVDALDVV